MLRRVGHPNLKSYCSPARRFTLSSSLYNLSDRKQSVQRCYTGGFSSRMLLLGDRKVKQQQVKYSPCQSRLIGTAVKSYNPHTLSLPKKKSRRCSTLNSVYAHIQTQTRQRRYAPQTHHITSHHSNKNIFRVNVIWNEELDFFQKKKKKKKANSKKMREKNAFLLLLHILFASLL